MAVFHNNSENLNRLKNQDKLLSQNGGLDGTYRELRPLRARTQERKLLWEPELEWENLNCS